MEKPHRELELYGYSMVPRGGWRFTVAETGVSFQSPDPGGLAYSVRKHMDANDIAYPPDFKEWFEDELCRQNGHGEPWCGPALPKPDPAWKGLSTDDLARFVRTVKYLAKSGFKIVRRHVAEERSRICAGDGTTPKCPQNVEVFGCPKCFAFLAVIARMVRGRKTEKHNELHACAACKCALRLKVWCPNDILDKAEEGDNVVYDKRCWRLKPDADPPA